MKFQPIQPVQEGPAVWYRFGKEDQRVTVVSLAVMRQSAYGYFSAPDKTIASGRFETPTLLYIRADKLTMIETDRVHNAAQAPRWVD